MERNSFSDQQMNQNVGEPNYNQQYCGNTVTRSSEPIYAGNEHLQGQCAAEQRPQEQIPVEQHYIYNFGGNIVVKANTEIDLGLTNLYIKSAINQFLEKNSEIDYITAASNRPEIILLNQPLEETTLQVKIQGNLTTPNNSSINIRDIQTDIRVQQEQNRTKTKAEVKDYPEKRKSSRKILNRLRHFNRSPVENKHEGQKILERPTTADNPNDPR